MKLIYSELYGISKNNKFNCFFALEINYTDQEKCLLPNLKADFIENDDLNYNISYLNFSDGLFNSLSSETTDKLKNIIHFEYKMFLNNCITKDIWKPFLFTSNIDLPTIKKNINSNMTNLSNDKNQRKIYHKDQRKIYHKDQRQLKVESFYSDINQPLDKTIPTMQKNIFEHFKTNILDDKKNNKTKLKLKYSPFIPYINDLSVLNTIKSGIMGGTISIDYEIEFNNELELLYGFLDCLFSSEYNFKIRNCQQCNKFYITLRSDTRNCTTCRNIEIKSRINYYENRKIIKLERKINSLFNSPYTNIENRKKYLKDKKLQKAKFNNNELSEEELKNWFLTFYKNEETRKKNDYTI